MLDENILECFNNIGVLIDSDMDNFLIKDYIEDSLTYVAMIVEFEQKFDFEIPDSYLNNNSLKTYLDIKNMVNDLKNQNN